MTPGLSVMVEFAIDFLGNTAFGYCIQRNKYIKRGGIFKNKK